MEDTQPLKTAPLPTDLLETDETGPLITPDIYEYIRLLYDGKLTRAVGNVLESPVIVESARGHYVQYPAPATAWHRDPVFRQWASRLGENMHRRSVENRTRFNILMFINAVMDYDDSYQSFAEWYKRQWRRGNQFKSWTMQEIQKTRMDSSSET